MITRYDKLRIVIVDAGDCIRFAKFAGRRAFAIKVHVHGNAFLVTEKLFDELLTSQVKDLTEVLATDGNHEDGPRPTIVDPASRNVSGDSDAGRATS